MSAWSLETYTTPIFLTGTPAHATEHSPTESHAPAAPQTDSGSHVPAASHAPVDGAHAHATTAQTAGHGEAAGSHGEGGGHESPWWFFFASSMLAFILVALIAVLALRRPKLVPGRLQNFVETLLEALYNLPVMVMGERGRKYAPFVVTFFVYIFMMNLLGFIPALKAGTANLNITLGLAIVAFIGVQYYGFREHGFGYLKHFLGPVIWLFPLILPLELLSELVRPISLSFRLFGNIYGEEQVIYALATQLGPAGPFLAVLFLPLQVIASVLQALVFTLLTTIYIALGTQHEESHGGEGEHSETSEAAAH